MGKYSREPNFQFNRNQISFTFISLNFKKVLNERTKLWTVALQFECISEQLQCSCTERYVLYYVGMKITLYIKAIKTLIVALINKFVLHVNLTLNCYSFDWTS